MFRGRRLRGFRLVLIPVLILSLSTQAIAANFVVFRKTYVQGRVPALGSTDTFDVFNPQTTWTLRAVNGDPNDKAIRRVLSATVTLNRRKVVRPQEVILKKTPIEREVSLDFSNTIATQIIALPGGQLTVEIFGQDTIPPVISGLFPKEGAILDDRRPTISATYADTISGINPSAVLLKLDGGDVTSQATVTPTSLSFTPTADLSFGQHTLELKVSDKAGLHSQAQSTFTIVSSSAPPVLNPIGDQTIPLGSRLTLPLTATDINDDPLTFSVSPLPLPEHAGLNAKTGVFTFKPEEDQVGALELTFGVSDGEFEDSETVTITVEGPAPGNPTSLSGRILDTNDFTQGIERPVLGATVSLLGTGFSTTSDTNGQFTLSGIPAGSQVLDIDTATASPAPDGSPYAGFREEITLIAGAANVVDRPFFLPRIAKESLTEVDPDTTTMVENPTLGVVMEVPAHTAKNQDGSDFTGALSISEVPEGLAPAALPEELTPGLIITIQPVGVFYSQPVAVTFPNTDSLPAGSEVNIWSLDPEQGIFVVVGKGRVTADGLRIVTIEGGIRANDWHFVLPPVVEPDDSDNNAENVDFSRECGVTTGSRTGVCSGNLKEEHALAGYRLLGESRSLRLVYNSQTADQQPVISSRVTIPVVGAVPGSVSTKLAVAGGGSGS